MSNTFRLRLTLDLDNETTMGDLRQFIKHLETMPDNQPVVFYEGTNLDETILMGYLNHSKENGEPDNG